MRFIINRMLTIISFVITVYLLLTSANPAGWSGGNSKVCRECGIFFLSQDLLKKHLYQIHNCSQCADTCPQMAVGNTRFSECYKCQQYNYGTIVLCDHWDNT